MDQLVLTNTDGVKITVSSNPPNHFSKTLDFEFPKTGQTFAVVLNEKEFDALSFMFNN